MNIKTCKSPYREKDSVLVVVEAEQSQRGRHKKKERIHDEHPLNVDLLHVQLQHLTDQVLLVNQVDAAGEENQQGENEVEDEEDVHAEAHKGGVVDARLAVHRLCPIACRTGNVGAGARHREVLCLRTFDVELRHCLFFS